MKESVKKQMAPIADLLSAPFVLPAAIMLKLIRKYGVEKLPLCRRILDLVGVFPIQRHYHEPLFRAGELRTSLRDDRELPGIDFNVDEQLALLERFAYNNELQAFPLDKPGNDVGRGFYYHNGAFESGDAEYLYNMVRWFKPSQFIEVGSGFSTLMAAEAIKKNQGEDPAYRCRHICIEPYENRWLEEIGSQVIRERVETVDKGLFATLGKNDMLFIDSTHVIRPQGDVLAEYLEILPMLRPGVLVQVHDIFTPKDYPNEWVIDEVKFWNEQYLLEAFLSFNSKFKVIGALNYLAHHHQNRFAGKCPIYKAEYATREPGSFWLMRV